MKKINFMNGGQKLNKAEMRSVNGRGECKVSIECFYGYYYLGFINSGFTQSNCDEANQATLDAECVSAYGYGATADISTCGVDCQNYDC